MRILSNPRFLPIYSGAVTAALLVLLLSGYRSAGASDATFRSIDVQRIRLVEPDGTMRMIIADNAQMPGVIFKGKEYPHDDRKIEGTAGMLFFDAEGTESGGLTFGGRRNPDGKISRFGHLSFDQYGQDEMVSLSANDQGAQKRTGIQFKDEPDWPLEDLVKVMDEHKNDTAAQRQKVAEDYVRAHGAMHVQRVWLGRNFDRSSSLELKDAQGRPRLVAKVAADGTPTLTFLDANGKPTLQWPR